MQLELHQQKALEFLLMKKFIEECLEHPKPINFYEWLHRKGLISESHLQLQMEAIKREEEDKNADQN